MLGRIRLSVHMFTSLTFVFLFSVSDEDAAGNRIFGVSAGQQDVGTSYFDYMVQSIFMIYHNSRLERYKILLNLYVCLRNTPKGNARKLAMLKPRNLQGNLPCTFFLFFRTPYHVPMILEENIKTYGC